jgi:recombination protein RecT
MATEYQVAMASDKKKAARFVRIVKTAIRNNPKLAECNALSVLGATMEMAQLDLDPALNEGWIVPYKNQATFQLGVRGLEKLFYRAVPDAILESHIVFSHDHFKYSFGANRVLEHIPYANEDIVEGEPYMTFVYAIVRFKNGQYKFEVMSRKAVEEHRDKYSKQYQSAKKYNKPCTSIWHNNFEEMAKNTVIKKLLKNLPKSVELELAMRDDGQVKLIKDANEIDASYNILEQPAEQENVQDDVEIPDANEVVVENVKTPGKQKKSAGKKDQLSELTEQITELYTQLNSLIPEEWNPDAMKDIVKNMLGVDKMSSCKDVQKLKNLRTYMQGQLDKIESELPSDEDGDDSWADQE